MTEELRLLATIHRTADIDDSVRVYGEVTKLRIGAHSRIDAFTIITVGEQGVDIADHVHIGAGVYIFGTHGKVTIGRYCSISPRAMLFTGRDEMVCDGLIGACAVDSLRVPVLEGDIELRDMSAIGAGTVVTSDLLLGRGAVIGAMSYIAGHVPDWHVVAGIAGSRRLLHVRNSVECPPCE